MAIAIEGSESAWPGAIEPAIMPRFDVLTQQRYFVEVFNRGATPFDFIARPRNPWVKLNSSSGTINQQQRVWVSVQWDKVPPGATTSSIVFTGAGSNITVKLNVLNPSSISRRSLRSGFAEGPGYVSIEAEHFTAHTMVGQNRWIKVEDLGHTLSAMRADAPLDAPSATPGADAACLKYQMYLYTAGSVDVIMMLSATLNMVPDRALRYAVGFDDQPSTIATAVPENYTAEKGNLDWEASVKIDGRISKTAHVLSTPGYHVLRLWAVDPGLVVRKIVVDLGGMAPSYLGPPESYHQL